MKNLVFLCLICVVSAKQVENSKEELTRFISLCDRNDPARDECFKKTFQDAVPKLKNGAQNLGIIALDPMELKNIRFKFNSSNILLSYLLLKSARIYGLSKVVVKSVNTDFTDKDMKIEIEFELAKVFLEGYYKGEGRISDFRYFPRGYFNMTAGGLGTTVSLEGSMEEHDGETYMKMRKFDMRNSKIERVRVRVDGIFAEKELNQIANDLINQNWRAVLPDLIPEAIKMFEPVVLEILNDALLKIPYKNMFLN